MSTKTHKRKWKKKYSRKLVKLGTKVEMEHTRSRKKARKIALDHFKEFGNAYYPALLKMERKLKTRSKRRLKSKWRYKR